MLFDSSCFVLQTKPYHAVAYLSRILLGVHHLANRNQNRNFFIPVFLTQYKFDSSQFDRKNSVWIQNCLLVTTLKLSFHIKLSFLAWKGSYEQFDTVKKRSAALRGFKEFFDSVKTCFYWNIGYLNGTNTGSTLTSTFGE